MKHLLLCTCSHIEGVTRHRAPWCTHTNKLNVVAEPAPFRWLIDGLARLIQTIQSSAWRSAMTGWLGLLQRPRRLALCFNRSIVVPRHIQTVVDQETGTRPCGKQSKFITNVLLTINKTCNAPISQMHCFIEECIAAIRPFKCCKR